ncbi:MAG: Uma2 family endonuclease [Candidatus Rokuibacteriota bacterium]
MAVTLKRKLDYDDYAGIPPDRSRYEILDGDLFVTPAPSPFHQRASRRLQRHLEDYFHPPGRAEVFNAPIDVILSLHDVVQPDLVVVADPAQVSRRGIEGAPLLVIEVLSPSTANQDRTVKARRYAALGIVHYWMMDSEARRIECYRLAGAEYALLVQAEGDGVLTHPDFPGLAITLAELWR